MENPQSSELVVQNGFDHDMGIKKGIPIHDDQHNQGGVLPSMGTSFFYTLPIVKNGVPMTSVDYNEVNMFNKKCNCDLLMYVVGYDQSIDSMVRFINASWGHVNKPKVFRHDDGYFIVHFHSMVDCDTILMGGHYTFWGKPVILKEWGPNFSLHNEILRTMPLWVRFSKLHLNCWGEKTLGRITDTLSEP